MKPSARRGPSSCGWRSLEWACQFCTFLNPRSRTTCEMCENKRPDEKKAVVEEKATEEVVVIDGHLRSVLDDANFAFTMRAGKSCCGPLQPPLL